MQIVSLDQQGMNQKTVLAFSKYSRLASSGGPQGLSFSTARSALFFSTTLAQGLSNTGVWKTSTYRRRFNLSFLFHPMEIQTGEEQLRF